MNRFKDNELIDRKAIDEFKDLLNKFQDEVKFRRIHTKKLEKINQRQYNKLEDYKAMNHGIDAAVLH